MKKPDQKTKADQATPKSRQISFRINQQLWEKIEEEMRTKEITIPGPIILSALRKRYGIEVA